MNMAIACEPIKQNKTQNDYKVWYLEIDDRSLVVGVGVKTKDELIADLFAHYGKTGKSNWRAFKKGAEHSTPIEIYDFISKNLYENTHFGNLPTLSEFQTTLESLQMNLELRSIA